MNFLPRILLLTTMLFLITPLGSTFAVTDGTPPRTALTPGRPELPSPETLERLKQAKAQMLEGERNFAQGKPEKAIGYYQEALKLNPNNVGSFAGLGKAYYVTKQATKSVDAFRILFYSSPDEKAGGWGSSYETDPELLMTFALALSRVGETQEALQAYRRGLSLLGKYKMPIPLPDLSDHTGEDSKPTISPNLIDAVAHAGVALAQEGHGDLTMAQVSHFKAAVDLQPQAVWAHYYYGRALSNFCKYNSELPSEERKRLLAQARTELTRASRVGNKAEKNAADLTINALSPS